MRTVASKLGLLVAVLVGCSPTGGNCDAASELRLATNELRFVYPDGQVYDLKAPGAGYYSIGAVYDPNAGPGDMLEFYVSLPESPEGRYFDFKADVQIPWPDPEQAAVGLANGRYGDSVCVGTVTMTVGPVVAAGTYDEYSRETSSDYLRRYHATGVFGGYAPEALEKCPAGPSPLEGTTFEIELEATPQCRPHY